MKNSLSVCLILFAFSLVAPAAAGVVTKQVVTKQLESITQELHRVVSLPARRSLSVTEIIYGNDQYGYFSTSKFVRKKDKIDVELLPPGYKFPIFFYITYRNANGNVTVKVGKKQFKSPVPKPFLSSNAQLTQGTFSSNYFLVTDSRLKKSLTDPGYKTNDPAVFRKDKYRFTYVSILNRFGEVVWLHIPNDDNSPFSSYINVKKVTKDRYAYMLGKKAGYYAEINSKGQLIRELNSKDRNQPFTMHHDFIWSPKNLMFLSNRHAYTENRFGKKSTYLSDVVRNFDFSNAKAEVNYDFLENFMVKSNPILSIDEKDDKKFVLWGKPKADFEFIHTNSITEIPGKGFLMSLRNLNKLVFFNKDFKKILWTMGPNKQDSLKLKKSDSFEHLHTPQLLGNNQVLLFDNGVVRKESRIALYQFDTNLNRARLMWQYSPTPKLYAKNRSSVTALDNGNFLAYFVSPVVGKNDSPTKPNQDYLIEISPKTNREVARMVRTFQTLSPGYRATPLDTLSSEKFLGMSPPKTASPRRQ